MSSCINTRKHFLFSSLLFICIAYYFNLVRVAHFIMSYHILQKRKWVLCNHSTIHHIICGIPCYTKDNAIYIFIYIYVYVSIYIYVFCNLGMFYDLLTCQNYILKLTVRCTNFTSA